MENNNYIVHTWDWKDEPRWEVIRGFIHSMPSLPFFYPVNTGSDCHAVIISVNRLTKEEQEEVKKEYFG